ncbi:MAG: hypothetical protein R2882_15770 [Gemmatimonadales bacterium]
MIEADARQSKMVGRSGPPLRVGDLDLETLCREESDIQPLHPPAAADHSTRSTRPA